MNDEPPLHATNPFATRWLRPGAIAYRFRDDDLPALLARLQAQQCWGEIVGPHGSGKSTLLAALRAALEAQGKRVVSFELHDRQRRLPDGWSQTPLDRHALLTVDGYEQLSRWNAWRLKRFVRGRGAGLIVTAHRSVGLPPLVTVATSLALAEQLVQELLAAHPSPVQVADVAACYREANGNLREMFFALYDLHERRSRHERAS